MDTNFVLGWRGPHDGEVQEEDWTMDPGTGVPGSQCGGVKGCHHHPHHHHHQDEAMTDMDLDMDSSGFFSSGHDHHSMWFEDSPLSTTPYSATATPGSGSVSSTLEQYSPAPMPSSSLSPALTTTTTKTSSSADAVVTTVMSTSSSSSSSSTSPSISSVQGSSTPPSMSPSHMTHHNAGMHQASVRLLDPRMQEESPFPAALPAGPNSWVHLRFEVPMETAAQESALRDMLRAQELRMDLQMLQKSSRKSARCAPKVGHLRLSECMIHQHALILDFSFVLHASVASSRERLVLRLKSVAPPPPPAAAAAAAFTTTTTAAGAAPRQPMESFACDIVTPLFRVQVPFSASATLWAEEAPCASLNSHKRPSPSAQTEGEILASGAPFLKKRNRT